MHAMRQWHTAHRQLPDALPTLAIYGTHRQARMHQLHTGQSPTDLMCSLILSIKQCDESHSHTSCESRVVPEPIV